MAINGKITSFYIDKRTRETFDLLRVVFEEIEGNSYSNSQILRKAVEAYGEAYKVRDRRTR